ncbi:MAG: TonB-dependent receptor [Bacteroidota bacterium]
MMIWKHHCFLLILFFTGVLNSWAQQDEILDLSLEELMDIEVTTASKSSENLLDAAAVMTVISEREIQTYGARHLMDVLDRVVGANTYGKLAVPNSIYSVRGTTTVIDNLHVLVLIDGRPTRESFRNGQYTAFYQAFPVESIKRIEVIRGPGSVLYGSGAYMGVVNIITKKGSELPATVRARYGQGNSMQFSAAGGKAFGDKVDIGIGLNFLDDGGWDFSMRDERDIPGSFEFRRRAYGANLTLNAGDFRLNAFAGQNEQNSIANRPLWVYDSRNGADSLGVWEVETPRVFINAGYDFSLNEKMSFSVDATYNHFDYKNQFKDVGFEKWQDGKSNNLLLEATGFIEASEKLSLIVGANLHFQTGEFLLSYFNADGSPRNILTNTTPADPPFEAIPAYRTTWFAGYAQLDYRVNDKIKLVTGMQVNKTPDHVVDVVPRGAAIFKLTDELAAKLMVSNAFRATVGLQAAISNEGTLFGNPDLDPETNTTYEAQLMHKTRKAETSLTFVRVDARDLIARTLPGDSVYVYPAGHPLAGQRSATPTFINQGTLTVMGVELESKISFNDWFYGNLGLSYYSNEDGEGRENQQGTPQFMLKLGLGYTHPKGVELGVFNTYAGETNSIAAFDDEGNQITLYNNPQADAYSFMTGNLTFDLNKLLNLKTQSGFKVSIYGVNLLDADVHFAEYARRRTNTMPGRGGRQIYGSFRLLF